MPTYDYVCGACGHRFEHFQSMTSRRLRKCPACGERRLERLVGAGAGVIFKGSGFYETDYKRAKAPTPDGGSKDAGTTAKDGAAQDAPKRDAGGGASKDGAKGPKED